MNSTKPVEIGLLFVRNAFYPLGIMQAIAVANQKGGVGKTTTSVNLSVGLARAGRRVLMVDLDSQAHATLHMGVTPASFSLSAYDVLAKGESLAAATVPAGDNLWVVPAHLDLSAIEMHLAGNSGRESILSRKLLEDPRCSGIAADPYDYLIIDCPPSLGLLSLNAMAAVDDVILPLQPHFLALHGLSKLLQTIETVSEHVNQNLRLLGVVLCMFEAGTRLASEIGRDVQEFFESSSTRHRSWEEARLFETRIRRNIRLAEAPSFGQAIFDYACDSNGAEDYAAFAAEVDRLLSGGREPVRCVA